MSKKITPIQQSIENFQKALEILKNNNIDKKALLNKLVKLKNLTDEDQRKLQTDEELERLLKDV